MKKKLIAVILTGVMLAAGMSTSVWADGEKSFVYGTTGYSEEMGDAGLNPHDNYSGWSALRYGVGETLFKYNDNMEVEPWLATDYEFVGSVLHLPSLHCIRLFHTRRISLHQPIQLRTFLLQALPL